MNDDGGRMISLKRSLDEFESIEQLHAATLEALLGALGSIEKHAVRSQEEVLSRHRAALRALRRQIAAEPSREVLRTGTEYLDDELKEYADQISDYYQRREVEIRSIMRLMAKASQSLQSDSEKYSSRFGDFARELEALAEIDQLAEIRRRLAREVERLRACAQEMSAASSVTLGQIQQQLRQYEQRLRQAEETASRDPLTGAANRREGEHQIIRRINAGQKFCILLFDLIRFKSINDRMGHLAGDEILRQFTQKLQRAVRDHDLVCRWGGDEFLVIMDCSLSDAIMRTSQISAQVFGEYAINISGQPQIVRVHASTGVAEHRDGETAEALFGRADGMLYREKRIPSQRFA
jgi:diguanylate cyclase (GGDEF)-like protein